jgi:hypothetical protein
MAAKRLSQRYLRSNACCGDHDFFVEAIAETALDAKTAVGTAGSGVNSQWTVWRTAESVC